MAIKTHEIIVVARRKTSPQEMHSIDRQTHIIGLAELGYDLTIYLKKIDKDKELEDELKQVNENGS